MGTPFRGIIDGLDSMNDIRDCWGSNGTVATNLDISFLVAVARIERQRHRFLSTHRMKEHGGPTMEDFDHVVLWSSGSDTSDKIWKS